MSDQPAQPPRQPFNAPSDEEIARMANVTAADIADAIQHLRQRFPELAKEWGLTSDRAARTANRNR